MHIDLTMVLVGLMVGVIVGMTGMGGGALMTPILVLFFGVAPMAAVSSDLVVSLFMKPVGAAVHLRRGTVNLGLVKWLCIGSVPAAFAGVLVLQSLGNRGKDVNTIVQTALGVALLLAVATMIAKEVITARGQRALGDGPLVLRPVPTIIIGILGGLVVGMTSVGSGSLIIVGLLLLYPSLVAGKMVGTDLVQAVPLVASAAFGHILFGDVQLSLTASLLIGAVPGAWIGARISAAAPQVLIRRALMVVLLASGLKLVHVPTALVGIALLGAAALAALYEVVSRRAAARKQRTASGEPAVSAEQPEQPVSSEQAVSSER